MQSLLKNTEVAYATKNTFHDKNKYSIQHIDISTGEISARLKINIKRVEI
jgi:c-di-GMP-binding flagellar brake protein YcgR